MLVVLVLLAISALPIYTRINRLHISAAPEVKTQAIPSTENIVRFLNSQGFEVSQG